MGMFSGSELTNEFRPGDEHIAIQVRDAILRLVKGADNPIYGSNVFVARVYAIQDTQLPAIDVSVGDVEQEILTVDGKITHNITINLECHVKTTTDDLDAAVYSVLMPAHNAITAVPTLNGLVQEVNPIGIAEPDRSGEQEQPSASKIASYNVLVLTERNCSTPA